MSDKTANQKVVTGIRKAIPSGLKALLRRYKRYKALQELGIIKQNTVDILQLLKEYNRNTKKPLSPLERARVRAFYKSKKSSNKSFNKRSIRTWTRQDVIRFILQIIGLIILMVALWYTLKYIQDMSQEALRQLYTELHELCGRLYKEVEALVTAIYNELLFIYNYVQNIMNTMFIWLCTAWQALVKVLLQIFRSVWGKVTVVHNMNNDGVTADQVVNPDQPVNPAPDQPVNPGPDQPVEPDPGLTIHPPASAGIPEGMLSVPTERVDSMDVSSLPSEDLYSSAFQRFLSNKERDRAARVLAGSDGVLLQNEGPWTPQRVMAEHHEEYFLTLREEFEIRSGAMTKRLAELENRFKEQAALHEQWRLEDQLEKQELLSRLQAEAELMRQADEYRLFVESIKAELNVEQRELNSWLFSGTSLENIEGLHTDLNKASKSLRRVVTRLNEESEANIEAKRIELVKYQGYKADLLAEIAQKEEELQKMTPSRRKKMQGRFQVLINEKKLADEWISGITGLIEDETSKGPKGTLVQSRAIRKMDRAIVAQEELSYRFSIGEELSLLELSRVPDALNNRLRAPIIMPYFSSRGSRPGYYEWRNAGCPDTAGFAQLNKLINMSSMQINALNAGETARDWAAINAKLKEILDKASTSRGIQTPVPAKPYPNVFSLFICNDEPLENQYPGNSEMTAWANSVFNPGPISGTSHDVLAHKHEKFSNAILVVRNIFRNSKRGCKVCLGALLTTPQPSQAEVCNTIAKYEQRRGKFYSGSTWVLRSKFACAGYAKRVDVTTVSKVVEDLPKGDFFSTPVPAPGGMPQDGIEVHGQDIPFYSTFLYEYPPSKARYKAIFSGKPGDFEAPPGSGAPSDDETRLAAYRVIGCSLEERLEKYYANIEWKPSVKYDIE